MLREYAGIDEKYRRKYSVGKLLNDLRSYEAVSKQVLHGEPVSKAQVEFVRESAPGLLKALAKELHASKNEPWTRYGPSMG